MIVFLCKPKTAYEMRISDWSSDVCSSDLTEWARWRLGRYERWGADQNETEILTPAAAFLAKSRWMPVDEDEGRFLRPNELWATADRRRREIGRAAWREGVGTYV